MLFAVKYYSKPSYYASFEETVIDGEKYDCEKSVVLSNSETYFVP